MTTETARGSAGGPGPAHSFRRRCLDVLNRTPGQWVRAWTVAKYLDENEIVVGLQLDMLAIANEGGVERADSNFGPAMYRTQRPAPPLTEGPPDDRRNV